MARYLSEAMNGRRSIPQPYDASVGASPVTVVLPTNLALNDIISLIDLPAGVALIDYDVFAPQLDSGGSPALAFAIGQENTLGTDLAVVYEAGLLAGRGASGSVARCTSAAAAFADSTVPRRIALKVTAAAATAASAGKTMTVLLHMKG